MLLDLFRLVFSFGVIAVAFGIALDDIPIMAVGGLVATLGYGFRDYFREEEDSVDPMTVFAFVSGTWIGLGQLLGFLYRDTEFHKVFFSYSAESFLVEAQKLSTIGVIVPLLIYPTIRRWHRRGKMKPPLPLVACELPERVTLGLICVLLVCDWLLKGAELQFTFLGTYRTFVATGSEIAIFLLTFHWLGSKPTFPRWTLKLLVVAVVADTAYSLLFSYMRGEIIYPFFMVFLAFLMRKALTPKRLLATGVVVATFAVAYAQIGVLRGKDIVGSERLTAIMDYGEDDDRDMQFSLLKLAARNCQFDQLSQVARIAEDDGFYYGKTLEYMTYVWIPRIIWPEKPQITPGQWFAERIGRGRYLVDKGKFSNSINMTLQGEMYLNWGWVGAAVGCAIMAFLYSLFWNTTGFFQYHMNPLGMILGLGILRQTTVSSSAAAIVHMVIIYVAVLSLREGYLFFRARKDAKKETRVMPFGPAGPPVTMRRAWAPGDAPPRGEG